MELPPFLMAKGGVIYLHVKVQPLASRNEIGETLGHELKVKVAPHPWIRRQMKR